MTRVECLLGTSLELAKKSQGKTSPNPCVGAVIVRGGQVIAEGWHRKYGADHAEVDAIKQVKNKRLLKGAEMYVTLEPCCHTGKTGPCCEAVVEAGIKKVYVGMKDPSKKVNGKGIRYLKEHGVKVELLDQKSDLAKEIREMNLPFIKAVTKGLPYVTLKAGMSLDGKIATAAGESKWITSEVARRDARRERALHDAVLIGAGTLKKDDPELKGARPILILGDSEPNLRRKVLRRKDLLIYSFGKANLEGEELIKVKTVRAMLKDMFKKGIQSVFVEGGSSVHGMFHDAFLKDADLIDQVLFYVAPQIIGGTGLSVIGGKGVSNLAKARKMEIVEIERIGPDLKIRVRG